MITWVRKNVKWLFSGIGVAALGWLLWLSGMFMNIYPRPTNTAPNTVVKPPTTTPTGANESRVGAAAIDSNLTPDAILTSVREAPLLQRPDTARQYVGITVRWDGVLFSGTRKGANTQWAMRVGNSSVFFDINASENPGLGLWREGDLVSVEGKIVEVAGTYIVLGTSAARAVGRTSSRK